nr:proline-rich protein 36-like [Aegilops tauschii subsp. strangulata]
MPSSIPRPLATPSYATASRRSVVVVSFLYAPRLVSRPPPALAIGLLPTHSRHDLAVDPLPLDPSGFIKPSTSFSSPCSPHPPPPLPASRSRWPRPTHPAAPVAFTACCLRPSRTPAHALRLPPLPPAPRCCCPAVSPPPLHLLPLPAPFCCCYCLQPRRPSPGRGAPPTRLRSQRTAVPGREPHRAGRALHATASPAPRLCPSLLYMYCY